MNGVEISTISLPSYEMVPALQTPMISLQFTGQSNLQTGSNCEINRVFMDETGPTYGAMGTSLSPGHPSSFSIMQQASIAPLGQRSVLLRETYRNELGQTAEVFSEPYD